MRENMWAMLDMHNIRTISHHKWDDKRIPYEYLNTSKLVTYLILLEAQKASSWWHMTNPKATCSRCYSVYAWSWWNGDSQDQNGTRHKKRLFKLQGLICYPKRHSPDFTDVFILIVLSHSVLRTARLDLIGERPHLHGQFASLWLPSLLPGATLTQLSFYVSLEPNNIFICSSLFARRHRDKWLMLDNEDQKSRLYP